MNIFTVGYEGLGLDDFLALLVQSGVDTVVDVRQLPLSRKPGFSKKALHGLLDMSGLNYVHMPALGCPKPVRDKYRENGSWKQYTEGFAKYLNGQKEAVEKLSALAAENSCALLCYEADYNFCHRSMVAKAVNDFSGLNVVHLSADAKKATAVASRRAFV